MNAPVPVPVSIRPLRQQLSVRRGLLIAAGALAVPGLWLGWPWLVAIGAAPVILAVAPCAVMCALGLCMRRMVNPSAADQAGGGASLSSQSCCSGTPNGRPVGSAGSLRPEGDIDEERARSAGM
jgi:hypothetical protein